MRAIRSGAAALLAGWTALHAQGARAEQDRPQPASRYTVMRLPDDPATHMPRMFIFDPQTARMWFLRTDVPRPYFDPVPYRVPDASDAQYETPEPAPPR